MYNSQNRSLFSFVLPALLLALFFSCASQKPAPTEPTAKEPAAPVVQPEQPPTTTKPQPTPAPAIEKKAEKAPEQAPEVFTLSGFVKKLSATIESDGLEKAIELFSTVPEEHKEKPQLVYMHASLLLSAGKTPVAKPLAQKLLKLEPKNTSYLFLNALIAKYEEDDIKKSTFLKQILELEPYNADANTELAAEQMSKKNYKMAKTYYQKSLASEPENITALFGYGQVNYYLGLFKDARNAFEKILSIDPEESMAWSYLAKLEAEKENYPEAIKHVQKALQYNDTYYNYWIDYADYLRYSGKFSEALGALNKAAELTPDYFLTYVYRGGLYEQTQNYPMALEDYKMVVKLNPQYYYAYESIGMLAWKTENWTDCLQAYEKAMDKNPNNVSYPLMISACYIKLNKTLENKNFLTARLKKFERDSLDYAILRLYLEGLGDAELLRKIKNLDNRNTRGKLLYYMGLFYELNKADMLAKELYLDVKSMNTPMFFEYRLCEWALEKYGLELK